MSDWYCSSASYATYTAFATAHAYSVGDLIVPTAPALKAKWVMRCTTAGTSAGSEPTWPTANNGTVTSNTAVFTNVTGQSTYFWTAAAGDLPTLLGAVGTNRFAAGDRIFVSSDHAETQTASTTYGATTGAGFSVGQVLSVSRAGSTPPVVADLTAGASCTVSGATSMTIESLFPLYHYGMTYIYTGSASGIFFGSTGTKPHWFDACQIYLNNAAATSAKVATSAYSTVTLSNTTVKFTHSGQGFVASTGIFELIWLNTANAIASGTVPLSLFGTSSSYPMVVTARGVDLSGVTTTLVTWAVGGEKCLFDSCKIASGVTRLTSTSATAARDVVDLVNCYDGANIVNERYQTAGALTTERTITLSGGATDDVGTFAHKLVSTANVDKFSNRFESLWIDVENTLTGSSKTATVEIISSTALNNDEISLDLEYQGTAGSSLASFVNSFIATPLTTAAAVTTSTATWNSSPATPQKQKLQVTFTPQVAGRVRGIVRLGKASATVYINPQIAIT